MVNEKRNANVVAMLVASLTVGAGVLLLLDPHPKQASTTAPLAAVSLGRVDALQIEWAEPGTAGIEGALCWIDSAGRVGWNTSGKQRIVVVSERAGLGDEQQRTLLTIVNYLNTHCGLPLDRISLGSANDPTVTGNVTTAATELHQLLRNKKFIRG